MPERPVTWRLQESGELELVQDQAGVNATVVLMPEEVGRLQKALAGGMHVGDGWVQLPVSEFELLHSRIRDLEVDVDRLNMQIDRLLRALSHD